VVISIAGTLGGPAGMVLAIPGYTLFRIVIREFFQEFQWVQALTKHLDDDN
jgi:predicted PurR-regulated permease PerM